MPSWKVECEPSGRFTIYGERGRILHSGTPVDCAHLLALKLWNNKNKSIEKPTREHYKQVVLENSRLHTVLKQRFGTEHLTPGEVGQSLLYLSPCQRRKGHQHVFIGRNKFFVRHIRNDEIEDFCEGLIEVLTDHCEAWVTTLRDQVAAELRFAGMESAARQVERNTRKMTRTR